MFTMIIIIVIIIIISIIVIIIAVRLLEDGRRYGRQNIFCIESVLHTPRIPVSMSALGFKAGGVMSLHVEDGVSDRTPTLKWGYNGALDNLWRVFSAYGIFGALKTYPPPPHFGISPGGARRGRVKRSEKGEVLLRGSALYDIC